MALDTKEKRASVPGIGRPWYRTKLPGAVDAAWRAASGNTYAGLSYTGPPVASLTEGFNPMLVSPGKMMNRV